MLDGEIARKVDEILSKLNQIQCPDFICKYGKVDKDGNEWPSCINEKCCDITTGHIIVIGFDEITCPFYEPKEE